MYTLCVYFAPFCSFTALYWQCFRFSTIIHARLTEYGDTGLSEPLSPHSSLSLTRTGTRGALGARERAAAPRPAAGAWRGEHERHRSLYRGRVEACKLYPPARLLRLSNARRRPLHHNLNAHTLTYCGSRKAAPDAH